MIQHKTYNPPIKHSASDTKPTNTRSGDGIVTHKKGDFFPPVVDHVTMVNFPISGITGKVLSTFTVEARNTADQLDSSYSGNVVLSILTGSGVMSGTTTKSFVNGVATFDDIIITGIDTFSVQAASAGLTPDAEIITIGSGIIWDVDDVTFWFGGVYDEANDWIDTATQNDRYYAGVEDVDLVLYEIYAVRAVVGFDEAPWQNFLIGTQQSISYAIGTSYYCRESNVTKFNQTQSGNYKIKTTNIDGIIKYYSNDVLKYTSLLNGNSFPWGSWGSINDPATYPLKSPRYRKK